MHVASVKNQFNCVRVLRPLNAKTKGDKSDASGGVL